MTIECTDNITNLMKAMLAVQGQVDGVAKDSTNPHFKNRYASLEAVVDAIRGPCQRAGLVVMQCPGGIKDGALAITTMITHAESGEWISSTLEIPVAKNDPQGAGSALSYGERYSLQAMFNLPSVDDDGDAASRPVAAPQARSAPAPVSTTAPQASGVQAAIARIRDHKTKTELLNWFKSVKPRIDKFSADDQGEFFVHYDEHLATLSQADLTMAG